MLTTRSMLFLTILPTPILALATTGLKPFSLAFPFVVLCFAISIGVLIASTTTRTRRRFVRKLVMSSAVGVAYFLMIAAVSVLCSYEWSASSDIATLAGPIYRMAAVTSLATSLLAMSSLTWLAITVEKPEPR